MTTYYTYTIKALDKHDKLTLVAAHINITDEDVMMATLKGKFENMIQGWHYDVVKQEKKISNRGNKARQWVSKVCKTNKLYRMSKADELAYQLGYINIK